MNQEEIEFKFLIKYLPKGLPEGEELWQAYLPSNPGQTLRIRKHSSALQEKYYYTQKSPGLIGRNEQEKNISAAEFAKYWQNKKPGQVHKRRYTLPLKVQDLDLHAEFDQYFDHLQGLLTVEVEVPYTSLRSAVYASLQQTFGYTDKDIIDVTEDKKYKNSNLTTVNIQDLKTF